MSVSRPRGDSPTVATTRQPEGTERVRPAPPSAVEDQGRDRRVLFRRLGFAVAAIAGLALALSATDEPDAIAVVPLYVLNLVLLLLPLFWPADPDPFAPPAVPAFLFGPEVFAKLIETIQYGTVDIAFLSGLPPGTRVELVQKVLGLWILSNLAYFAAYYLGTGKRRIARIFPNVAGLTWNRGRLAIASAVCFAAFLAAYTFFQSRVDASITDFTALGAGKAVWRDDTTMSWLGRGVLLGTIPLLFWVAATAAAPTKGRVFAVAAVCVVMALLTTRLGQRGHGLMFGLSCLTIVHNVHKRFKATFLAILAFAALISLDIMGEWRRADGDSRPRTSLAAKILSPEKAISSYAADRNRISVMATVMYYVPDRQDYFYGESYAALLAAPIPKWLWPEKDVVLKWRDSAIAGNLHGIPGPTPMHCVFYANFSWIGAAVGMFLWGFFQRGLYEWLVQARGDGNTALLYTSMLLTIAPSNLALAMALQYVLPIWLILKFVGQRWQLHSSRQPGKAAASIRTTASGDGSGAIPGSPDEGSEATLEGDRAPALVAPRRPVLEGE